MTDVRKATDTHSQLENVGNYELMRQQNIQRNLEMMKVLGLNKLQVSDFLKISSSSSSSIIHTQDGVVFCW